MTKMPDANQPEGWQNQPPAPPAPMGMAIDPNMYAAWPQRALAYLIDVAICGIPGWILMMIGGVLSAGSATIDPNTGAVTAGGSVIGTLIGLVGYALMIGLVVWNMIIKQGKTGQSIGKAKMGIKLISEQTAQPLGPLMTFVRMLVHIVDQLPCYIGFFWPLWDQKRQTFADKIMNTVVIPVNKA